MRQFAKSQQWEVQGEFIDHKSGKHADRQQFRRLFDDASQRVFDSVLFWALDRFTREGPLETLQTFEPAEQLRCAFRSFTEAYLDTCGIFKEAVIAILGTIAEQERIRISERVRAGLERARKGGKDWKAHWPPARNLPSRSRRQTAGTGLELGADRSKSGSQR